jgi:hypothetical protein
MSRFFSTQLFLLTSLFGLSGCRGPEEGFYSGTIGSKENVIIEVSHEGGVTLDGYWKESLNGRYETESLKGETMDALVFEGPESKKFKLRFLYQEDGDDLLIRAIHSRTYGPGARYVPTEKKGVFDPPPRLFRQGGKLN